MGNSNSSLIPFDIPLTLLKTIREVVEKKVGSKVRGIVNLEIDIETGHGSLYAVHIKAIPNETASRSYEFKNVAVISPPEKPKDDPK